MRVSRETNGRGGKEVTVIYGLPVPPAELKAISKTLKQKCGVGGAIKGEQIEIQGDQRATCKSTSSTLDLPANSPVAKLEGNECL